MSRDNLMDKGLLVNTEEEDEYQQRFRESVLSESDHETFSYA